MVNTALSMVMVTPHYSEYYTDYRISNLSFYI
jgi:hypothetical protein